MIANCPSSTLPAQELQYLRDSSGDCVLYCSKYTPRDGKPLAPAFNGACGNDVGVLTLQICVLRLKLYLEQLITEEHPTHYRVLTGREANYLAAILRQMRKGKPAKWHEAVYGADVFPFLYLIPGYPPTIGVPRNDQVCPRIVKVGLFDGQTQNTHLTELRTKEQIEAVVENLRRKVENIRRGRSREPVEAALESKVIIEGSRGAERRSGRPWAALEQLLREAADPSSQFDRLYAIDRLDDWVWGCAQTHAYFDLQAREYMKANYSSPDRKWIITLSKPVMAAVNRALATANRLLPATPNNGHNRTPFDDWDHQIRDRAGKPKFEIARILIWPRERLQTEEGYAVLRQHRIFNIPLFYLEPAFVTQEPQDEYILFCKSKHDERTSTRDLRGLAWDSGRRDWKGVGELDFHPLDHFLRLLAHPKLVFAMDARDMLQRNVWERFANSEAIQPNLGSGNIQRP